MSGSSRRQVILFRVHGKDEYDKFLTSVTHCAGDRWNLITPEKEKKPQSLPFPGCSLNEKPRDFLNKCLSPGRFWAG